MGQALPSDPLVGDMSRIRPTLRRLRDHLRGRTSDRGGFDHRDRVVLEDWGEVVEQALRLVGAGLVQSWEVNLAELRPLLALRRTGDTLDADLERWSDALVPLETPFRDLINAAPQVMKRGREEAIAARSLSSASRELLERIEDLPGLAERGWSRSLAHLDPILAELVDPESVRERVAAEGSELRRLLEQTAATLRADLSGVESAPSLSSALFDAIDTWKDATTRALEFAIAAWLEAVEASERGG